MNAVNAIALSAIIALSGWLRDGLKEYDGKNYDKAIANLTKVCESKKKVADRFKDIALFYRAKSYQARKKNKEAIADLATLTKKHPTSTYSAVARKLYLKLGGDPKKLLPAVSPKQVWEKFVDAAKAGDVDTMLKLSTESWRELVKRGGKKRLMQEFGEIPFVAEKEIIGKGKNAGTATLAMRMLNNQNNVITLEFILDEKGSGWLIKGFKGMTRMRRHDVGISNLKNLQQIGLACRMYSNVHNENFPPNLNALKTGGFLENDAIYLWTNSKTGKKIPFIYCPGLTEASSIDFILATAPMSVNGMRETLYVDGHVKNISEKKFKKIAATQKWNPMDVVKKEDIPKDKKALIEKLIKQLGNKKFKVRRDAKKSLISMGYEATPILEDHLKDPDPEIKMSLKEILHIK